MCDVRYMVEDVGAAVSFYTTRIGFTLLSNAAPPFADVTRGDLRLLPSGSGSSAGRCPTAGARRLEPHPARGGRSRGRGRATPPQWRALPERRRDQRPGSDTKPMYLTPSSSKP